MRHKIIFSQELIKRSNIIFKTCLNNGTYIPIRAAFRFVTQKPWLKIPVKTQTFIYENESCILVLVSGAPKLVY